MRRAVTAERVTSFMKALGASVKAPGRVFLAGGASAVLLGWRSSTSDVDLKIIPTATRSFEACLR
jgi:hypothetical protein